MRTSPWPAGVPCWADVTAPDLDAARAFYGAVLGWTFEGGGEEYGGYVNAFVDGAAAAGLAPLQEGATPAWTLYVATPDADAALAAATAAGGTVVFGPVDVGPLGRMAVLTDPTGVVFGVWQAGDFIGAQHVNAPGSFAWDDLRSPDPDAARAFYGGVFGWRFEPVPMAGPSYTTAHAAGEEAPLGGLGDLMGMPGGPRWDLYFEVADHDAALAVVEAHGGKVLAPAFDTPYGRMAPVADPAGATLWLMQSPPDQPRPDREG